jgi:hypothetical protein
MSRRIETPALSAPVIAMIGKRFAANSHPAQFLR